MANGNGNTTWIMWVLGIVIVTVIPYVGNAVIENDKSSRARDEKIEDCLSDAVIKQSETNQAILVSLKEIQTDLKYIKRETSGRNN